MLGSVAMEQSDASTLRSSSLERLELARAAGSTLHQVGSLNGLGVAAMLEQDYAKSRNLMESALEIARASDDRLLEAVMLGSLGYVERLDGKIARARDLVEKSLELFRSHGTAASSVAESLCNYADVLVAEGALREAAAAIRESLELSGQVGHRGWLPAALTTAASVVAREGLAEDAALLLGAARELEAAIGVRILAPEHGSAFESTVAQLRVKLGNDDFESAFERGRTLSIKDAIRHALSTLDDDA
jgi:non-specific serine/threonine protein kinase